ncbi:LamG domain-containing protein [Candidatus Poribacteria bacterium]|nr:LamG domain-containing protein [Candidatus Poribacteria bacterium]
MTPKSAKFSPRRHGDTEKKSLYSQRLRVSGFAQFTSSTIGYIKDGKINGAKWVDGKFGKALSFDGAESVDMGNPTSLQFAGDYTTIAFWAKPSNVASGRQNIICKAYGGEGCLTMEPSGALSFYWGACGGNCEPYVEVARPNAGTFKDNEWIHGVETRDVSIRKYNMYKDGAVAATDAWVKCGAHPCGDPKASGLNLLIGDGYAGKFRGIIDEVAIFNVVLTENDIKSIMTNGLERAIGLTAVSPSGKLATTWGDLKQQ